MILCVCCKSRHSPWKRCLCLWKIFRKQNKDLLPSASTRKTLIWPSKPDKPTSPKSTILGVCNNKVQLSKMITGSCWILTFPLTENTFILPGFLWKLQRGLTWNALIWNQAMKRPMIPPLPSTAIITQWIIERMFRLSQMSHRCISSSSSPFLYIPLVYKCSLHDLPNCKLLCLGSGSNCWEK